MEKDQRSTYGTTIADPDQKAGVEVGGGEKAAARKEAKKSDKEPKPGSKFDSQHEKRPEGPHADPKNTNEDATPGAGTLPNASDQDATSG
ncbi:hypothetical protein [Methylopila sp. M107]|uniref:hypothetical protein n=1 Tax=Methylopila sp. M107 TaxID=1101190 RepID=UPI0012DCB54B|nr:hypothetical protein [Methylopila sp. M107]